MSDSDITLCYAHESNVQPSTLSDLVNLLEIGLNKIRVMTQTPTARTTAISVIDEEIDASMYLTRSLISSRNALVPISSLPPELLARVFGFYALVEPWSGVQKLGWIGVTHVCQRWRQVALNDASLWARIVGVLPSAAWISEVLVRARDAPLLFDIIGTPSTGVLSKIPSHMSHTRKLRLLGLAMDDSQAVRGICASKAPVLEHFELGISDATPITFHQLSAGSTLFKGHSPKLRSFTTSRITVPWSLIPRGQLTQLRIILSRGISTPSISSLNDSNQLFDLLINSPELENLSLEFCLPSVLSQVSHGEPIHLPHLLRLSLGGSTPCVANLLKRLELPSSATLHLYCVSEDPSTYPDHLILPLISAHFHNPAPVEFKSFGVNINCREHLIDVAASIFPTKSTIYHSWNYRDSEPELTLSFYQPSRFSHISPRNIFGQLCSMLAISNLQSLSISSCDDLRDTDWYELFQHCKKITTIQAKWFGTIDFLRSLAPPKSTNVTGRHHDRATQTHVTSTIGAGAASTSPFPTLTSLLLEALDFDEVVSASGDLYHVFADTLRRRKENKTPLKALYIDHCIISTKQVNSLQKLVREVHWDGEEGPSYDE